MKEKVMQLLFESLTNGENAEDIISLSQKKIFDNPVMLTNASFRVLSLSSDVEVNDPVWKYAKLYNCCSKESIDSFKNDEASDRLFKDGKSFLYNTNLGENIPRILGKIQRHGKTMGYLIVFYVKSDFKKLDLELSDMVCQCLSVALSKNGTFDISSQDIAAYTLTQLLQSDQLPSHDMKERIQNLNWQLKPYFQVLYISYTNKKEESYISYITEQIELISKSLHCVPYNKSLMILCNYQKEESRVKLILAIEKILLIYNLRVGVSLRFNSLLFLKDYYYQAKKSLEIGQMLSPDDFTYYFKDYDYYSLIFFQSLNELRSMQCQEFLILKRFDKQNNANYVDTLVSYYINSLNIKAAAQELFIHRNTMTYRLEKIKELINCDSFKITMLDSVYHSYLIEQCIICRTNEI